MYLVGLGNVRGVLGPCSVLTFLHVLSSRLGGVPNCWARLLFTFPAPFCLRFRLSITTFILRFRLRLLTATVFVPPPTAQRPPLAFFVYVSYTFSIRFQLR